MIAAAVGLLLAATTVHAEGTTPYPEQGDDRPGGLAMAADLVLGRPLGLVGSVIGTAVFIAGLPFEVLSGDVAGPGRRLVVEPLEFTFTRPLGEFR
jgi:hypothetical protein